MKTRHAQLLALALAGALFAPAALADRGQHDHKRSSVVIHLGTGHGSHLHATRSWKKPSHGQHHHHRHNYRQGYRDGYRAGLHTPPRPPHHKAKGPHRRPKPPAHALPPGHYRPVPGHKVHVYR